MYLKYQSQDDFSEGRDIVRCNPSFHGRPRFDFLHINLPPETGILGLARVVGLYQCRWGSALSEGKFIVEVRMLDKAKWKPKTLWSGCDVRQLSKQRVFVNIDAVVRAAHMHPAFGAPSDRDQPYYYLDDAADNDWFIRSGN
jgi:hypothetical protein